MPSRQLDWGALGLPFGLLFCRVVPGTHSSPLQVQEWLLDAGITVFLSFSKDHGPQQRWVGDKIQFVLWFRSERSEGLLLVLGYQPPIVVHDLFNFPSLIFTFSFEGQDAPGPPVVQVLQNKRREGVVNIEPLPLSYVGKGDIQAQVVQGG